MVNQIDSYTDDKYSSRLSVFITAFPDGIYSTNDNGGIV